MSNSKKVWLVMFVATLLISAVTLVIFGAIGGLLLLVALNGFSESTGGAIIVAYAVAVLAGNFLVAGLCNLLISRRWFAGAGLSRWSAFVPALIVTAGLILVGPPLSVLLIKAFG
ncbi:MAG: hypothetical protein LC754_02250 [Acidobacteria bacterium]|nr:hypothetical protein [Acidobacteriota bacterium]